MSKSRRKTEEETDHEMRQYETLARREAAWGMYSAHVREQNYHEQVAKLHTEIAHTSSRSEREVAQHKLEGLLRQARSSTTLVVGTGVGCSDPEDFD